MKLRTLLIALTVSGCMPTITPEEARLSFAEVCANAPETRALIRDKLVTQPGLVDLSCILAQR